MPQFSNLTIDNLASVVAQPWDGSTGGVVAIDVLNTLTVNGTIDVSGQGFRGGQLENLTTELGTDVTIYRSASGNAGAEKGESVAGSTTTYDGLNGRFGRGAPANGGGEHVTKTVSPGPCSQQTSAARHSG